MSYQVLARKYRPQKFSDVIGQEHVTRTLQNAIEQDQTPHANIFSGHRGISKTTRGCNPALKLSLMNGNLQKHQPEHLWVSRNTRRRQLPAVARPFQSLLPRRSS